MNVKKHIQNINIAAILLAVGWVLFLITLGLLIGYGLGEEISKEHYQYELNLRDLNLQNKLCIQSNKNGLYGKCVNEKCLPNGIKNITILEIPIEKLLLMQNNTII